VGHGFLAAPIGVKREFAKTIDCYALKGTGRGVSFDVIHWQTGKRIANWNGYRLDVVQGGETLDPYSSSLLYSTP